MTESLSILGGLHYEKYPENMRMTIFNIALRGGDDINRPKLKKKLDDRFSFSAPRM